MRRNFRQQHEVGERFENDKIIYEVRESLACEGCAFLDEDENECKGPLNIEPCLISSRHDNKSVIFVQVGEADSE